MTDVKSIPALPLSREQSDAAVKAILEARKVVKVEAPVVKVQAEDVHEAQLTPTAAQLTASSLIAAPAKGEVSTAEATTPDEDVTNFLKDALPQLVELAQQMFTPPFSLTRALTQTPKLMELVSFIVATGLPAMKGLEAKALVVVVFRWLFRTYVAPRLGAFANIVEPLAIKGLEAIYQAVVKGKVKQFMDAPDQTHPFQFFKSRIFHDDTLPTA